MVEPLPSIAQLIAISTSDGRTIDRTLLDAVFQSTAPRVRFFKNLPPNASVLEVGAGTGMLPVFRTWLEPARPDVKLYALDVRKGENFERYDGYVIADYASPEAFAGIEFDAICSSNFVEHITGGIHAFAPWAAGRLAPGGLLFVEGPSANMKRLPRSQELIDAGLHVGTTNFYDDETHVDTDDLADTRTAIESAGFFVEESGYWRNRFIEDEMLRVSQRERNVVLGTYAVWMKAWVEQYVTGVKREHH